MFPGLVKFQDSLITNKWLRVRGLLIYEEFKNKLYKIFKFMLNDFFKI